MTAPQRHQRGLTMIEVLMTIFVVSIGLLGLAGMQSKMMVAQFEAYQRAQAATILKNIVSRLHANGAEAMSYVTAQPLGTERGLQNCDRTTGAQRDLCDWNNTLVGAAETSGSTSAGAMLGARGCISVVDPTPPQTLAVAVVWQGMSEIAVPGVTACGAGNYGDEKKRRALTARVTIACFENDPVTRACIAR